MKNNTKYTSKQVQINHNDDLVYSTLSSFSNFDTMLKGKVEGWEVEGDCCSFKTNGIKIGLKLEELVPNSTIKMVGNDGCAPFPFTFWIQIKQVETLDSRMRIVLDVELNMMMKMMIGNKLQEAIDKIADQIAHAFNTKGAGVVNDPSITACNTTVQ